MKSIYNWVRNHIILSSIAIIFIILFVINIILIGRFCLALTMLV